MHRLPSVGQAGVRLTFALTSEELNLDGGRRDILVDVPVNGYLRRSLGATHGGG